jgi:hypothetical protein
MRTTTDPCREVGLGGRLDVSNLLRGIQWGLPMGEGMLALATDSLYAWSLFVVTLAIAVAVESVRLMLRSRP